MAVEQVNVDFAVVNAATSAITVADKFPVYKSIKWQAHANTVALAVFIIPALICHLPATFTFRGWGDE